MKVVNIMNFARGFEPRDLELEKKLISTTINQMKLVNEMQVAATFLFQYEVLADDKFVSKIKENASDNIEFGFWYEVVEPLTSACGLPYESKYGWKWDWHIKPGFSMSYPNEQRKMLIDEAMRKFKEVFGYYPKTVGSWLLDTFTVNYLSNNYEIDAMCFCRDQINTDAYTLVGGYFNQAYYPSKNNMFTPAQSVETQLNVPMFRLLGPDPIHNYDYAKYVSSAVDPTPFTMEPVLEKNGGGNPEIVDWYLKNYFENESLGFAYMQIGQENSFCSFDTTNILRMQIEKIKNLEGVKFEKMCDTGKAFKEKYHETPATSISALDNWDTLDVQSVYYNCKNYTANIFRHENKVFIRSLYLFDDKIEDVYNSTICDTYDALYENMPIVDTAYQTGDTDGGIGIILDDNAKDIKIKRISNSELEVYWNDKSVRFSENGIYVKNCKLLFSYTMINTDISHDASSISFDYKNNKYYLNVNGGVISSEKNIIKIDGENIILIPSVCKGNQNVC